MLGSIRQQAITSNSVNIHDNICQHSITIDVVRFKSDPLAASSFLAALAMKKQQEGQIWIGLALMLTSQFDPNFTRP